MLKSFNGGLGFGLRGVQGKFGRKLKVEGKEDSMKVQSGLEEGFIGAYLRGKA